MYVEFEKKYQYNQEDVFIINYLSDISGIINGISLVGWDEDFVSNTTKMLKDNFVRFELWLVSKKDCDFLQLMELETMKSFERDSSEFLKENYFAHSGMDIEKGHYNRLDGFYMEVERWYETYLEKSKKALQCEIEIMENVSMDLDKRIKADADLFEKYQGINIDVLVEGYDQYEALYNGEWIQLGSYPEEGQYNPNPKEREQALNILRGLYGKIKQYEQQIKADMAYLEGNLMAYPHIKEKISCMANICRDYHDRIEFIENLNVGSEQDIASTPIKKVDVITKANKKYFDRAVAKGYAEENNGSYVWKTKKVMLGYFVYKVYCQDVTDVIPYKAVEGFFEVTRLDSTIYGLNSAKKEQKWRGIMNKEIFFD